MLIGIDVAKAELVVATRPGGERWTAANDERGYLIAGDTGEADAMLLAAIDTAARHRLPHQIQRVRRIAARTSNQHLAQHAATTLAAVCSYRIVNASARPLDC